MIGFTELVWGCPKSIWKNFILAIPFNSFGVCVGIIECMDDVNEKKTSELTVRNNFVLYLAQNTRLWILCNILFIDFPSKDKSFSLENCRFNHFFYIFLSYSVLVYTFVQRQRKLERTLANTQYRMLRTKRRNYVNESDSYTNFVDLTGKIDKCKNWLLALYIRSFVGVEPFFSLDCCGVLEYFLSFFW